MGTVRIAALIVIAVTTALQPRDSASCQTDIVSATVVSTFCGHTQGENQVLDLVILWRGKPGWFQGISGRGSGGTGTFGPGLKGEVSRRERYGDVWIEFAADFDRGVARIGPFTVDLAQTNTVAIDNVEGDWRLDVSKWTDPRLPLGDWNLALARQSREVREFLRCDVAMPRPPSFRTPVVTVCEKLKRGG